MKNILLKFFTLIVLMFLTHSGFAQQSDDSNNKSLSGANYDAHEAFKPLFYKTNGNNFRTADGTTGPGYWQNAASYNLHASLNEKLHLITGTEDIIYTNNSPDDLEFLWMQLDQNIFKADSKTMVMARYKGSRFSDFTPTNGFVITSVVIKDSLLTYSPEVYQNDTRMKINLHKALKANGHKLHILINYSFQINSNKNIRTGMLSTPDGTIFSIAQWYPRMAVYDDISGWNNLPYLGSGEFYLDYGDFDLFLDVPSSYLVAASGALENAKEVLSITEQDRLKKAAKSDNTVFIRTRSEIPSETTVMSDKIRKVWHFRIKNARDASWACSSSFIWDAARINLPDGRQSLAQSFYPKESAADTAWGRSTEYIKHSIEFNSANWFPYPYPDASNVASNIGGMEYPGIVFCRNTSTRESLWGVTDHEFGHTWFPMIVGSNERKFMWMDEGFNTFIDQISTDNFNQGEYRNKPLDEHKVAMVLSDKESESILTRPDVLQERRVGVAAYRKPGQALTLLRNEVLGKDRFDKAFQAYISSWAYKHPQPDDFFRSIENSAGEDLGWFWRGWFMSDARFDQAVTQVNYTDNDITKGIVIKIENLQQMVMPAVVEIVLKDGTVSIVRLPVEVWQRGGSYSFSYPSIKAVKSVTIDPDHIYPDIDSSNNTFTLSDK